MAVYAVEGFVEVAGQGVSSGDDVISGLDLEGIMAADAGEDQHANNTDETVLSSTLRHDCGDGYVSLVISKNAGELG
jgi:hypothetical protein